MPFNAFHSTRPSLCGFHFRPAVAYGSSWVPNVDKTIPTKQASKQARPGQARPGQARQGKAGEQSKHLTSANCTCQNKKSNSDSLGFQPEKHTSKAHKPFKQPARENLGQPLLVVPALPVGGEFGGARTGSKSVASAIHRRLKPGETGSFPRHNSPRKL